MRSDVPPDLLKKIYSHVSSALRDHILNSGLDVSQVDGLTCCSSDLPVLILSISKLIPRARRH